MKLKNKQFLKWKDMTEEERDEAKKYTGAVVLKANKGFHYYPVVTNDFGSLYPSCIISHNISPDRRLIPASPMDKVAEDQKEHIKWEESDGTKFHYVYLKADPEEPKWKKENKPVNMSPDDETQWNKGFNQYQSDTRGGRGILPQIEMYLLKSRKRAKKLKAEAVSDGNAFMTGVYDGQQLAYKLCANSLYGLMGAVTSDICCKPVAASITATGRQLLQFAIDVSKELYPESEVIYGDTDSIMVRYPLTDYDPLKKYISDDDKERLNIQARDCGLEVERVVSERLPYPHVLEMEKIFFPFILLSKKRYAAIQYDSDMRTHSKINYSGIVMTRRDNAPIVKKIFGHALDIIMFEHDIDKSVSYVQKECIRLLNGEYDIEEWVSKEEIKSIDTGVDVCYNILLEMKAAARYRAEGRLSEIIAIEKGDYDAD
jgi:DNA polymerase delta subunit 1